jgi:hypothetical protein
VLVATAVERARFGGGGRNGLYDITVAREDGTPVAEVRGRTRVVGGITVGGAAGAAARGGTMGATTTPVPPSGSAATHNEEQR